MFTRKNNINTILCNTGLTPENLTHIPVGVMTDKYSFIHEGEEYIIRCYPKERSWLAEVEFHYMTLFCSKGIKCPTPVKWNSKGQAFLVYKKLKGTSLDDVYNSLSDEQKETLCCEIIDNYNLISSVKCVNYGSVKGIDDFSHISWREFLTESFDKALSIFEAEENESRIAIGKGLLQYSNKQTLDEGSLVWSDFSADNIIVTNDGHLVGFIDFEGLMSGDPLLGLGYLIAHGQNKDFTNRIIRLSGAENRQRQIDFYAVLRYCRLLPYAKFNLPNGEKRTPIAAFLPYASAKLTDFSMMKNCKLSDLFSLKLLIMTLTIVVSVLSIYWLPHLYSKTLETGKVETKCFMAGTSISSDIPVWFSYTDTTLATSRSLDNEDVALLRNLVNDSSAQHTHYIKSLNQLAFMSNTLPTNFPWLFLLTLCFVQLGCVARTLYDFIGWSCYKGGQDMAKWWPWYLFRPFIGVPIASLLLVATRTSLFSSLFTSRDLNTYLAISFLAGYAIMEFLKMLRRVSKTLFEGE